MISLFKSIAMSKYFSSFITAVIVIAGFLVGMQTYPAVNSRFGSYLDFLDKVILWIFVIEVFVKVGAEGSKPWLYFKDAWNLFDFSIVAVCFLPIEASFVAVLRLARIMRVLKLVTAIPKLQLLVNALLKSIPSMGYISLLLGILFYIYACVGVTLFAANDPHHFGNLQTAVLSLFRVVTLEDWTDLMYIAMYGCEHYGYDTMAASCTSSQAAPIVGALYFVSFVLFGTMIVLNLFIGVIMNGMDEAKADQEDMKREGSPKDRLLEDARAIEAQAEDIRRKVASMTRQLQR